MTSTTLVVRRSVSLYGVHKPHDVLQASSTERKEPYTQCRRDRRVDDNKKAQHSLVGEHNHNVKHPLEEEGSESLLRHQVPHIFWELHILTGYRKTQCTLWSCIQSAFWLNNETVNFWTHFIPSWYFLFLLGRLCVGTPGFLDDGYYTPFGKYLACIYVTPLVSCFAHLFNVISTDARHICFFMDYAAVTVQNFGVALCYLTYCFDERFFNTWISSIYLPICFGSSMLCTIMACQSRFANGVLMKKVLRTFAFVQMYLLTCLPLFARLVLCWWTECADSAIPRHYQHLVWTFFSFVFYGFHIPEAFAPGHFDIFGHSHQIFHVCCMMTSYHHVWACYEDMTTRRPSLLAAMLSTGPVGRQGFSMFSWFLLVQFLVLLVFIFRLVRYRIQLPGLFMDRSMAGCVSKLRISQSMTNFGSGVDSADSNSSSFDFGFEKEALDDKSLLDSGNSAGSGELMNKTKPEPHRRCSSYLVHQLHADGNADVAGGCGLLKPPTGK